MESPAVANSAHHTEQVLVCTLNSEVASALTATVKLAGPVFSTLALGIPSSRKLLVSPWLPFILKFSMRSLSQGRSETLGCGLAPQDAGRKQREHHRRRSRNRV